MKMEKKCYYAPRAKFIKLKIKAAMLAGSPTVGSLGDDNEELAKGCTLFFDEDED